MSEARLATAAPAEQSARLCSWLTLLALPTTTRTRRTESAGVAGPLQVAGAVSVASAWAMPGEPTHSAGPICARHATLSFSFSWLSASTMTMRLLEATVRTSASLIAIVTSAGTPRLGSTRSRMSDVRVA
ncbi:hypothetical protein D9M72_578410 [compost metagenome]